MRKLLLVLALVAAAFAGGAAVNGPGLQWLKGLVRDRLSQDDHIPTLDVDDGSGKAESSEPTEPEGIPAAPAPIPEAVRPTPNSSANVEPEAAGKATDSNGTPSGANPVSSPEPNPPLDAPEPPPNEKSPAPTGWEDAPGPGPTTAVVPKLPAKPKADSLAPTGDEAVAPVASAPADPPSEPVPAEPPPLISSTPASMPVPPLTPASSDWTSLRKRMKTLGVKEYIVQGTPGGAVTFRCTAPEAGPDSTARTFEAEGDDEFGAAESVLRRIAVWRATRKVKE